MYINIFEPARYTYIATSYMTSRKTVLYRFHVLYFICVRNINLAVFSSVVNDFVSFVFHFLGRGKQTKLNE